MVVLIVETQSHSGVSTPIKFIHNNNLVSTVCVGVVKMAFFDTFMIKRTINEEIIILLLQQVKIGD